MDARAGLGPRTPPPHRAPNRHDRERHTRPRYIQEEGYTTAEAEQKWRSSLRDPAVRRQISDGILKLAVEGHEAYVTERGTQQTQPLSPPPPQLLTPSSACRSEPAASHR